MFQAGDGSVAANTVLFTGFCVAASMRASAAGTSAANTWCNIPRSMYRYPAASGLKAFPRSDGYSH